MQAKKKKQSINQGQPKETGSSAIEKLKAAMLLERMSTVLETLTIALPLIKNAINTKTGGITGIPYSARETPAAENKIEIRNKYFFIFLF